jgi:hypothetical protein
MPSFIFRPLRPICILVRTRILFGFMYDLDLCMYIWILDSWSLCGYIIYSFVGSIMNLCNCSYLIPPASRGCCDVHEALGGAFPKRHHVDCGVIAIICKVPVLGHHSPPPDAALSPISSPRWGKPKGQIAFPRNILQAAAVVVARSGGSRSSSRHPSGEGNPCRRPSPPPWLPPEWCVSSLPWTTGP